MRAVATLWICVVSLCFTHFQGMLNKKCVEIAEI